MKRKPLAGRSAKILVGALCAGVMIAGQSSIAWGDSTWSYPVPSQPTTVNKNLITFGSQGDIWGEILGISDVTRNSNSGDFNSDGTISAEGVAKYSVVNLFGSSVNTNPNPYYANLIYNSKASSSSQVDHYSFADKSGLGTGIDRGDSTLVDAYGGVSATMSYRPDILLGNCATSWQDPGSIVLRSDGKTTVSVSNYKLAVSAAYDSQVTTIRSLTSSSQYYKSGDENYNPYYVENLSMYGDVTDTGSEDTMTVGKATIASTYSQMYRLVDAIEGVMAQDSTKTTRYGNPRDIAVQYESYGRGLQDYVLSKIADGTVQKKKVAVVYNVNTDENTVTLYKSSPNNTVEGTGSSFSGPYKHMEALENVTENIAGTWSTTEDTKNKQQKVITDISELKNADAIILCYSSYEEKLKTVCEAAGISESDLPPVFSTYATTTSRSIPGFPMLQTDGLEMMAEELGFVYPEVINPVYALAYYYTQFYHVKSDTTTLSNVLSYNIENMSLPTGITADLSNYSDNIIDKAIKKGLKYYAANKDAIDAEHPKLKTTSNVTLPDPNEPDEGEIVSGMTGTVSKAVYTVNSVKNKTVTFTKYKGTKTTVTVPKTVTINGVVCKVNKIASKAFRSTKVKTVKVKSTYLTKSGVKSSLKSSKVTKVVVPSSKYKAYKKIFTKANAGKKVTVKK